MRHNLLIIGKKSFLAKSLKKNISIPYKSVSFEDFLKKKNNWGVKNFLSIKKKYSNKDIAATVQGYLEKIFQIYIRKNIPKKSNLLLAGGIFANVKLNKKIY